MKKHLLYTFVALTGAATLSYAQQNPINAVREAARNASGQNSASAEQGRGAAEKAIEKYYGNGAKVKIAGEHEVNGVRVYTADVTYSGGSTVASATADGHLIETGRPSSANALPEAVRQVTQGVFQATPSNIDDIENHYFYAHLASGGHTYIVKIEATGRIIEIKSPEQLREDAAKNEQTAAGAQRQQIEKLVQQHFPKARVTDVRTALHMPGYYQAFVSEAEGSGYIILSPQNEVAMYRLPQTRNELPQAVQRTLSTVLKGDQIKAVGRGVDREFRVSENVGTEQVTLWVGLNGDVERVGEKAERAITAGHRTGK